MLKAPYAAMSDDDSDDNSDKNVEDSSSSESSSASSSGSDVKKKVSFGVKHKNKFRETASLKAVNGDVEAPDSPKAKSTVWSRLRDTVMGATQKVQTSKPEKGSAAVTISEPSEPGGTQPGTLNSTMKSTRGSMLGQVTIASEVTAESKAQGPTVSGGEWVAKLQSTEAMRKRHKESCQSIAAIFEDLLPDQVWSLSTKDRITFMGRIGSEVQNAMQFIGLAAFEVIENSQTELVSLQNLKVELETKLLEMQRTYLKEISTNRDRSRDPKGMVAQAIQELDDSGPIEFYEPLQYLSDDQRASVMSIVDEKVKQLLKNNAELQQCVNFTEMNKFETMMLGDKAEGLERMNAGLREEAREIRSKLKKAEHKLAKTEWELSEAKRHNTKTERELLRYQAAQAAEVTKAMGFTLTTDGGEEHTKGSRRPTRFSVMQSQDVPVVPPICGQRRSTRFAKDDKMKKRCSFAVAIDTSKDSSAHGENADGQEAKACSSCGAAYLPEALFCSRCGQKLGDCPPAEPSTPKKSAPRRNSRFVAAFDDDLNLESEECHSPVLANATSTTGTGGIRSFASVVANAMKTATGGGSKASSKKFRKSKTMEDVEGDGSPIEASTSSPKNTRRSVVPSQEKRSTVAEAVFSDEEEQLPKAARPKAKRQMRKSHTIGQETSFRKTESMRSITSWSSAASQASFASAAACKSPPPASELSAASAEPEPPSPREVASEPQELQQEPEVTGGTSEKEDSAHSAALLRITQLELDLEEVRHDYEKARQDGEKARHDCEKIRRQLTITLEELSDCRRRLEAAEEAAESRLDKDDDQSDDLTDCQACQRAEKKIEELRQTNELLSKELEVAQCFREHLEQAGFVLANAEIGRLEAITSLDETPAPQDFLQNYKYQLQSDRSLAEELDKIKSLLGEDSALCQTELLPKRPSFSEPSPSSSSKAEAKPEAKPEGKTEGRKRSKESADGRREKPSNSHRKEAQEEMKANAEIEKLVERNKLFQDKVNIKSAQLASVCKENQVLKLALEDMQREVNTLTNDLRNAMPSQEVAPPNLESVLDRMEQVVKEGKVPVHMRLHQEAKLRDVAVSTKRTKIADTGFENDRPPREIPARVFSPESTCSVQSFASAGSKTTDLSTQLSASTFPTTKTATLSPLSSPRLPSKARKGSDDISRKASDEIGEDDMMGRALSIGSKANSLSTGEELKRPDKKRSTMTRHTLSLGGPALDAAEEIAVQKVKSNPASPRNPSFAARRSETLMAGAGGEKSLPPVSGSGTGEQKGNLLLGCKGGMALFGSSAKKPVPVR